MTLTPEDIEKIRDIIETRSARTDAAIGNLEERIFDEIEKVAQQVSKLSDGQQAVNDRTTKLESSSTILMESRMSQGKRIGELELAVVKITAQECGENGVKGKTSEWVRWIIPILLTLGAGLSGFFVGGQKP